MPAPSFVGLRQCSESRQRPVMAAAQSSRKRSVRITRRKWEGGADCTRQADMGRNFELQPFRAHSAWTLTGDGRSSNGQTRMVVLR